MSSRHNNTEENRSEGEAPFFVPPRGVYSVLPDAPDITEQSFSSQQSTGKHLFESTTVPGDQSAPQMEVPSFQGRVSPQLPSETGTLAFDFDITEAPKSDVKVRQTTDSVEIPQHVLFDNNEKQMHSLFGTASKSPSNTSWKSGYSRHNLDSLDEEVDKKSVTAPIEPRYTPHLMPEPLEKPSWYTTSMHGKEDTLAQFSNIFKTCSDEEFYST